MHLHRFGVLGLLTLMLVSASRAGVYNLRVVTDASPDYSDLESLIHSATSRWESPEEKLWAMFYWNHRGRRQMRPMIVHGTACTDPIRQFNDYGETMCSTISGINCAIWDAMGYGIKYWDISNHTVPEVEYGGRWHMYDNSLSALYTLCDGVTIAGVADIGATLACVESGGRAEPGHIAKYHCLTATSANGFLTGSDTARSLDSEYRCFNPNGLKYRSYFHDWDRGHRYILNLRAGQVYDRRYQPIGDDPTQYVPNGGKDPNDRRFGIRGNGRWTWEIRLTPAELGQQAYRLEGVRAIEPAGVEPSDPGQPGEVVFKLDGANVICSLKLAGSLSRAAETDRAAVAISTTNGLTWTDVWSHAGTGEALLERTLIDEVNGAYEVLVKVSLSGAARLSALTLDAVTMLNAKTQPQLLLGRNTVYVGAGEPTGSIVCWPDLRGDAWKPSAVESQNMVSEQDNPGYQGTMHAVRPKEEAWVVFRLDAQGELTQVTYGGRLYNRAKDSRIDFLHSFDEGRTWTTSYSLTDTAQPWDVIHFETVAAPRGAKSVLVKYLLNSSEAGKGACSLYSVRMEADYQPADPEPKPVEVTFRWRERQKDYTLVERSHTQRVEALPATYPLNVGGVDHPVVDSLSLYLHGTVPDVKYGYSDGQDAGGEKWIGRWVTYGNNLAVGKPYTVSLPSNDKWGAGDPDGRKLTDGVVGPPYGGGTNPSFGLGWDKGQRPQITVDLGTSHRCAAVRINVGAGWPWWDALQGQVQDDVEVLTSLDGATWESQGHVPLNLRRSEIPINHLLPDTEALTAHLYDYSLPEPVEARYVRFDITPQRSVCVNEVEVLEFLEYRPFDLRVALP